MMEYDLFVCNKCERNLTYLGNGEWSCGMCSPKNVYPLMLRKMKEVRK